jgi:hypothetical protein
MGLKANPLPLAVTCVMLAVVPPEFVIAAAICLLLPSVTVPKFKLVGIIVSWGAVGLFPVPFDPEELLLFALTPAHPAITPRKNRAETNFTVRDNRIRQSVCRAAETSTP